MKTQIECKLIKNELDLNSSSEVIDVDQKNKKNEEHSQKMGINTESYQKAIFRYYFSTINIDFHILPSWLGFALSHSFKSTQLKCNHELLTQELKSPDYNI